MEEDEPMDTDIPVFNQHTLLLNRHEETYDPKTHSLLIDAKNTVNDEIMNLMRHYSTYYYSRKFTIEKMLELLIDHKMEELTNILVEIHEENHIGRWNGEVFPGLDPIILEEQKERQKRFEQIWSEFSKHEANKELMDLYTEFSLFGPQLDQTKTELKEKTEKFREIKEKCHVVESLPKPTSFSHFPQVPDGSAFFEATSKDQSTSFKRSCDLDEDIPSSNKKMRFME